MIKNHAPRKCRGTRARPGLSSVPGVRSARADRFRGFDGGECRVVPGTRNSGETRAVVGRGFVNSSIGDGDEHGTTVEHLHRFVDGSLFRRRCGPRIAPVGWNGAGRTPPGIEARRRMVVSARGWIPDVDSRFGAGRDEIVMEYRPFAAGSGSDRDIRVPVRSLLLTYSPPSVGSVEFGRLQNLDEARRMLWWENLTRGGGPVNFRPIPRAYDLSGRREMCHPCSRRDSRKGS